MIVNDFIRLRQYEPLEQQKAQAGVTPPYKPSTSFADTLNDLVQDTNQLQKDASKASDALIKGEPVDIHDVMIQAEKSKTSFALLMELRNKALDLYREAIRVQV